MGDRAQQEFQIQEVRLGLGACVSNMSQDPTPRTTDLEGRCEE